MRQVAEVRAQLLALSARALALEMAAREEFVLNFEFAFVEHVERAERNLLVAQQLRFAPIAIPKVATCPTIN
ncbi:MAG: hypothetical protein LBJ00_18345 [Planctomycetaceae bacterium]|nr:hypothetical protein [Planctomycetaceae bacterium]